MIQTLSFDKLPLWLGVSERPVNLQFKPFRLNQNSWGLIKQAELTDELITQYENDSYQWITPPPGASNWANYLGDLYFDYIKKHFGKKFSGKTISEVGAGSTYIANKIIQNFNPSTYNIIDPAIRETNLDKRIKVYRNYLDDNFTVNLKSDFFVTLNVLEHVHDPQNFMQKIYANLTPDGEAIMIFPNIENQFNQGDFNGLLHEHLNYFTKKSSEDLFALTGFEVLDFHDYEDTFYYVLKKTKNPVPQKAKETNIEFQSAIEKFKKNHDFFKTQMQTLLKDNKKIAFHGATNGLNNLLGMMDSKDFSQIELFDGDDFKTGKFISSFPKAIHNVKDYEKSNFDFIIISAMTFAPQIRKFLKEKTHYKENQILTIYPCS